MVYFARLIINVETNTAFLVFELISEIEYFELLDNFLKMMKMIYLLSSFLLLFVELDVNDES